MVARTFVTQNFCHVELSSHYTSRMPTRLPDVSCFYLGHIFFLINFDAGRGWRSVGKCGGRCGKVCWGIREDEGRCGDGCKEVCWGVGRGKSRCGKRCGEIRESVWGECGGCGEVYLGVGEVRQDVGRGVGGVESVGEEVLPRGVGGVESVGGGTSSLPHFPHPPHLYIATPRKYLLPHFPTSLITSPTPPLNTAHTSPHISPHLSPHPGVRLAHGGVTSEHMI